MAALGAHRGVSAQVLENTLEAFELAITLKTDFVEFDVQRTRDGVLVVHHDDAIDGYLISDLYYEEILTTPAFSHIPTLSQTVQFIKGRTKAYIEIKNPGYERETLEIIQRYLTNKEFVIISFEDEIITSVKQLAPGVRAGLLLAHRIDGKVIIHRNDLFPMKRLRATHADFLGPRFSHLFVTSIVAAYIYDVPMYYWTVNRPIFFKLASRMKKVEAVASDIPPYMAPQKLRQYSISKQLKTHGRRLIGSHR